MKKFLIAICLFFISATCFAEKNYVKEKNNFITDNYKFVQLDKKDKSDSTSTKKNKKEKADSVSTKIGFFKRLFKRKTAEEKRIDSLAKDSAKNAKILAKKLKKEEKDSLKVERKNEKIETKNLKIARKELEKYIESRKVAELIRTRENYNFFEVVKYKYPEFQSDDIAIRSFNTIEDENLVNIKNNNLNYCKIKLASSIIIALDDAIKESIDSKIYFANENIIINATEAVIMDNLDRIRILYEQTTRTENNDKYRIITAIQLKNYIIEESIKQHLSKLEFLNNEKIDTITDKTFEKLIPKSIF